MDKKISIVTGASSGLGREIALLLTQKGHVVYGVARSKDKLEELKKECDNFGGEIKIVSGDLTDSKVRKKLIGKVLSNEKKIDYLINNAGFGKIKSFEDISLEEMENMYALNDIASQHLTQLALESMKKRGKGRIINVASVVAFVPPSYFSVYNATKAAVYNFTRSLSFELYKTGVSASALFPARMSSGFWDRAFKKKDNAAAFSKGSTKPRKVAKYLVKKLDSKRLVLLPGFLPKMYFYVVANIPGLNNFVAKHVTGKKTQKLLKGGKNK